jgi:hypothetical protein
MRELCGLVFVFVLQRSTQWERVVYQYKMFPLNLHNARNTDIQRISSSSRNAISKAVPRPPFLPEFSYSGTEGGRLIPPHCQNRSSTAAQSQPLGKGSNPPNPHPPERWPHIYIPDPKASSQKSPRVGENLMNQIPGMRFTQPLDFRFATTQVLH